MNNIGKLIRWRTFLGVVVSKELTYGDNILQSIDKMFGTGTIAESAVLQCIDENEDIIPIMRDLKPVSDTGYFVKLRKAELIREDMETVEII